MLSKVADRIKECREDARMGVDDLAKILGKNRATVYRYEKDEIENMPVEVISKIAVALNVDPAYLMGWTDEKAPFRKNEPIAQLDDEHAELIERCDALDECRKDQLMNFLRFLESGTGR